MARGRNRAARAADAAQPQPVTSVEPAAGPEVVGAPISELDAATPQDEPEYQPTATDLLAAEAMRMHYERSVPREEVDRWYADKIGVAWQPTPDDAPAEPVASAVVAPAPAPKPAASPYLLRRRLVGNVTAHGFTVDGVPRDHWWVGEVADFKPAVVESAPSCFAPVYS